MIDDQALKPRPWQTCPLTFEFIGGPKDGTEEDIPSDFLETRIGGHVYKLAIAPSGDEATPYKYVLVSRTLSR